MLTDDGWTKNGDGFWADNGNVPTIRWMVNTGNTRRESTQAFLIPLLAEGFNVIADNCEACLACSSSVCQPSTTTWPVHLDGRRTRPTSILRATRSRRPRTATRAEQHGVLQRGSIRPAERVGQTVDETRGSS